MHDPDVGKLSPKCHYCDSLNSLHHSPVVSYLSYLLKQQCHRNEEQAQRCFPQGARGQAWFHVSLCQGRLLCPEGPACRQCRYVDLKLLVVIKVKYSIDHAATGMEIPLILKYSPKNKRIKNSGWVMLGLDVPLH